VKSDPNLALLILGLIRTGLWIFGAMLTLTYKNYFAFVGCILYVFVALPRAFYEAHYYEPAWLQELASIMAFPATAFIVAGIWFSAYNTRSFRQRLKALEEDVSSRKTPEKRNTA
jgi:fructose-specific phosphotransferase system IIC component